MFKFCVYVEVIIHFSFTRYRSMIVRQSYLFGDFLCQCLLLPQMQYRDSGDTSIYFYIYEWPYKVFPEVPFDKKLCCAMLNYETKARLLG